MWSLTDNLRANTDKESSEYATTILGLIFFKFPAKSCSNLVPEQNALALKRGNISTGRAAARFTGLESEPASHYACILDNHLRREENALCLLSIFARKLPVSPRYC